MNQKTTNFNQLYDRYNADIYRFSFWLCGSVDESKDIVAETFIRLWTAKNDLKAETVKGYLLTIARNIYLQNRRKQKEHLELDNQLMDTAPDPNQVSQSNSELASVVKGLQKLTEIDRSILIMRAYEGLSYQEISRILELPITNLKVKVHRARLKLALIKSTGEKHENK